MSLITYHTCGTLASLQKREIGLRLLPFVQTLLHLTPVGCGHRTTRVTTRTVSGTGFDSLPALGVFPHGMGLSRRLAGLVL